MLAFVCFLMLSAAQGAETIVSIQIHGNTLTSDVELRRLAAVEIGSPLDSGTLEAVADRLRATKRFESVQVLKRFASIADPSQILLVIIVDEGPVKIERTGDPDRPTRVVKMRTRPLMFLPVLSAEDGYGVTYGVRFALPEPAGKASRIGFPLTWGGDKRAAAEFDKTFDGGAIDRLSGGAAISRRTNPFYDADDTRRRAWVRAERHLVRWVRAGATAGVQRVTFPETTSGGATGARVSTTFGHAGADVTFDTRVDPVLPRNAVFARAAWEHIDRANRTELDARGYVGLFGQTVLALRAQRSGSDRSLAPYLKPLLGGMNTVRGFKAGTAAGDTIVATSAEVLVPLTSPIVSAGRIGVSAFVDAGTAYDDGQRLADQEWKRGIGGSVWFSATAFKLTVAVAHGRGSSTRVHVGANVSF